MDYCGEDRPNNAKKQAALSTPDSCSVAAFGMAPSKKHIQPAHGSAMLE
jgi:hypothetical protein